MVIDNTNGEKIKIYLNSTELSQSETPTPDNPVDVNVIKGNNIIKISNSDNTEEQNYPISLGNLEYCKIGDYRDQIFKNTKDSEFYDSTLLENEWYLKKNIGKVILDGGENWNYVSGTHPRFTTPKSDIALQEFNVNAPNIAISNYFKASNWYSVYSFASVDNAICSHNSNHVINIKSTQFTNVNDFKTWLSTHNTKVYYVQTTPTYIHISESDYSTLKAQLDNLYNNAISYVGTTNITQTNDDLPFTIDYELIEIPKDLKGVLNDINEFLRVNL